MGLFLYASIFSCLFSAEQERTDQIIQQMQSDLESTKERSDTIVLQLTQQLDQQTKLLQDLRPKEWWYHRIWRRDVTMT